MLMLMLMNRIMSSRITASPGRAQACRFGPRPGELRLTASAPGRTSTEAQPLKRLGPHSASEESS
jgi:hypothetical protein